MPGEIKANRPQGAFLSMKEKFKAFVAGFGTGKTWVLGMGTCLHFCQWPRVNSGYFAPTYPQIRDIFYPTIDEVAYNFGMRTEIKEANKEVHFYYGRMYYGTCICRSMERPETIIGFKIGYAVVDELDVMALKKAELAWRKVIARMRYNIPGLRNGIDIGTTPEGFKFTYKKFVTEKTESYGIINASTYENEKNLPPDYIPSLIETYPENAIDAYLNGNFVNMVSGSVYKSYNRNSLESTEEVKLGEPVYVGQDFNVCDMTSCIFVRRNDTFHAVDQLVGVYDTPELIRILKEKYPERRINLYPDASGGSRKTANASETDIILLRQAGFYVMVNKKNPFVRDRILSVNKAFESRKVKVNTKKCPKIAESLEKQCYDQNGEPDKSSGFDHACDAFGYFVHFEMPVKKPVIVSDIRMPH